KWVDIRRADSSSPSAFPLVLSLHLHSVDFLAVAVADASSSFCKSRAANQLTSPPLLLPFFFFASVQLCHPTHKKMDRKFDIQDHWTDVFCCVTQLHRGDGGGKKKTNEKSRGAL